MVWKVAVIALRKHMPTHKINHADFFTVRELASLLKMSTRTVERLVSNGDIASHKIRGRRLVERNDLENYLRKCREPSIGE